MLESIPTGLKKDKMKGYPSPKIELYGPPSITSGGELAGSYHLDLRTLAKGAELKSVSIKLEGVVMTYSADFNGSSRQKRRLYCDRQVLCSDTQTLSADEHKWSFNFGMPPGYLPPSFRLNNRVYIQFSIRATAKFAAGSTRTSLQLEHNPVHEMPGEQWGLTCCHNWLTLNTANALNVLKQPQSKSIKMGETRLNMVTLPQPKLSIKDKIRGKCLYPVRIEVMYPENGILAGSALNSLSVHLVRDNQPLPYLSVKSVTVSLNVLTQVSVNKHKFVDKNCVLLMHKQVDEELPGQISCDISRLFQSVDIPAVDATFTTKTLSRSYQLVLRCAVSAGQSATDNAVVVQVPVVVFTRTEDEVLPAYQLDRELPAYVIEV